jgi:hypothetical protein
MSSGTAGDEIGTPDGGDPAPVGDQTANDRAAFAEACKLHSFYVDKLVSVFQFFIVAMGAIAAVFWGVSQQDRLDAPGEIKYRIVAVAACGVALLAMIRVQLMACWFEYIAARLGGKIGVPGFTEARRWWWVGGYPLTRATAGGIVVSAALCVTVALAWSVYHAPPKPEKKTETQQTTSGGGQR